MTFVQGWANVEDVGPALYKCYTNGLCLLGGMRLSIQSEVLAQTWFSIYASCWLEAVF